MSCQSTELQTLCRHTGDDEERGVAWREVEWRRVEVGGGGGDGERGEEVEGSGEARGREEAGPTAATSIVNVSHGKLLNCGSVEHVNIFVHSLTW